MLYIVLISFFYFFISMLPSVIPFYLKNSHLVNWVLVYCWKFSSLLCGNSLLNKRSFNFCCQCFRSCDGLKIMRVFPSGFIASFFIFSSFSIMCLCISFFVFILLWDYRVLKFVSWFLLIVLENSQPLPLLILSSPSRILITLT